MDLPVLYEHLDTQFKANRKTGISQGQTCESRTTVNGTEDTRAAHTMKTSQMYLLYTSGPVCSSEPIVKDGMHFPVPYEKNVKQFTFAQVYFFLFQQHFLSFNFKQSLANLCTFQRLFRTGYDTICTPDKYISSVVFIVTELANTFRSWYPLQGQEQRDSWG